MLELIAESALAVVAAIGVVAAGVMLGNLGTAVIHSVWESLGAWVERSLWRLGL